MKGTESFPQDSAGFSAFPSRRPYNLAMLFTFFILTTLLFASERFIFTPYLISAEVLKKHSQYLINAVPF